MVKDSQLERLVVLGVLLQVLLQHTRWGKNTRLYPF